MALINCKDCGQQISDAARFCPHCGAPVVRDVYCPKCGTKVPENVKFCPNCGTKYVTQDVVQNFQQNYYTINQNKIENAVFQGGNTERTYFERFDAFRRLGQLGQAIDVAEQMREKFPQKAVTWYCSLYVAYELSNDKFDHIVQNYIPHERDELKGGFGLDETKKWLKQWFLGYKASSAEIEKELKSRIEAKKQGAMREEIVYPVGNTGIPCESYVRDMEERAAMFETPADKDRYAPFLELLAQKKEEFARRLEEAKDAIREFNAEYRKTVEDWGRRAMAEFRSMKNRRTARKAVAWTFGLIFFALFVSIFIAAIVTL